VLHSVNKSDRLSFGVGVRMVTFEKELLRGLARPLVQSRR